MQAVGLCMYMDEALRTASAGVFSRSRRRRHCRALAFTFTDNAAAESKGHIHIRCQKQLWIVAGLANMCIGTISGLSHFASTFAKVCLRLH